MQVFVLVHPRHGVYLGNKAWSKIAPENRFHAASKPNEAAAEKMLYDGTFDPQVAALIEIQPVESATGKATPADCKRAGLGSWDPSMTAQRA